MGMRATGVPVLSCSHHPALPLVSVNVPLFVNGCTVTTATSPQSLYSVQTCVGCDPLSELDVGDLQPNARARATGNETPCTSLMRPSSWKRDTLSELVEWS